MSQSKYTIACITPLDHIPEVLERITELSKICLYRPKISKNELKQLLRKECIHAIFTNPNKQNFILDRDILSNTSVKLINTASTGLNHIDLEDCKDLNINVLSLTQDYELIRYLPSTSELAFGLALSLIRKIPQSFNDVKLGNWNYEPFVGRQLAGMTAGIIGYGRLGTYMARYCNAFGMKVLVNDPYKNVFDYDQVSKKELYERCDLISLHVHVKHDTVNMINKEALNLMSKKPYIVNTSRGEIVNEKDMSEFIRSGGVSGYGTDVLIDEFSSRWKESYIVKLAKESYNVIITPHIGGMSIEGQKRAYLYAAEKFNRGA